MADMIVAGAGTTAVNGTYVENGTLNGKPKYTYSTHIIQWDGRWVISYNGATTVYKSNENVATPDLVTTWAKVYGASPVPTVTAASSSQNLTLTCAAGSYSLTGTNATLTTTGKQNLTLACNAGTYSLTGTNADLTVQRNYTLTCEAGSYALTGTTVSSGTQKHFLPLLGVGK